MHSSQRVTIVLPIVNGLWPDWRICLKRYARLLIATQEAALNGATQNEIGIDNGTHVECCSCHGRVPGRSLELASSYLLLTDGRLLLLAAVGAVQSHCSNPNLAAW